jgi:hypothetical protein
VDINGIVRNIVGIGLNDCFLVDYGLDVLLRESVRGESGVGGRGVCGCGMWIYVMIYDLILIWVFERLWTYEYGCSLSVNQITGIPILIIEILDLW